MGTARSWGQFHRLRWWVASVSLCMAGVVWAAFASLNLPRGAMTMPAAVGIGLIAVGVWRTARRASLGPGHKRSSSRLELYRRRLSPRKHPGATTQLPGGWACAGLATRERFYDHLRRSVAGRHPSDSLAVLVVHLDRCRATNHLFVPHLPGDELWRQVGIRLTECLEDGEWLTRLGADEFGLVLSGNELRARAVAKRLCHELERPFSVSGTSVKVEASVGIALWPAHGAQVERLLARADIAMVRAKAARAGSEVFRFQGDAPGVEGWPAAIGDLRAALSRHEIVLHYQPRIDVSSGDLTGLEALAHWQSGEGGLAALTTFVPLVEQVGLMPEMTRQVLDAALRQLRRWDNRGLHVGSVAVKVSTSCLFGANLPTGVAEALERADMPGDRLTLQFAEDCVVDELEQCRGVLTALRRTGVRLSLEECGGDSALRLLRQLPLDELSLERSFGQAVPMDDRARATVRSAADLARAMGVTFAVEGIETSEGLAFVRRCGAEVAQGPLFGEARPAKDVEEWLVRRGRARRDAEVG